MNDIQIIWQRSNIFWLKKSLRIQRKTNKPLCFNNNYIYIPNPLQGVEYNKVTL